MSKWAPPPPPPLWPHYHLRRGGEERKGKEVHRGSWEDIPSPAHPVTFSPSPTLSPSHVTLRLQPNPHPSTRVYFFAFWFETNYPNSLPHILTPFDKYWSHLDLISMNDLPLLSYPYLDQSLALPKFLTRTRLIQFFFFSCKWSVFHTTYYLFEYI